ncbi:MAG TPA: hypothetical protein VEC01_15875 [Noviherbaspirillum sp.]|uniref:hypothetical protein n=1 Tax=Noviherbaspirillum sp. TaxID=1926288 RepID=UPI002D6EF341|nr:hypothetical protein [Noviherbaspirillum sp.]HYD96808.1 hypothetical protein [Noviherbaspirillum sp.]
MKPACALLVASLALPALAQDGMRRPADPSAARPAEPGMSAPPGRPMKIPSDPGAVVRPPPTGNEEMVKTPKNIDPEIDNATPEIDRKNRSKAQRKGEQ